MENHSSSSSCCKRTNPSSSSSGCCQPIKLPRPDIPFSTENLPPGKQFAISDQKIESGRFRNYAQKRVGTNMTYTGEALRACVFHFGGLSAGSIALAGDGGFRGWQPVNNINHNAHVPNSFFAINAGGNAVLLQSSQNYDQSDFTPAPLISDHLVPPASIDLLNQLPGIPNMTMNAKYPIVNVNYEMPVNYPATVSSEFYNPFIPLDVDNSSLPVVISNFTVANNTSAPLPVSLMMTQQNFVGWNGYTTISGNSNPGYGGNVNQTQTATNYSFLRMTNTTLRPTDAPNGQVTISAIQDTDHVISFIPTWTDLQSVWKQFLGKNRNQREVVSDPSPPLQTWNGAVLVDFTLAPNTSHTVTFVISWHFPNRYVDWTQPYTPPDPNSSLFLGNMYSSTWPTIDQVNNYLFSNFSMLQNTTRLFRDTFYNSSLPWQILESAGGRMGVCRSPTCLVGVDRIMHAFEGCNGASTGGSTGGCCPMDCTHVWTYEMTLSRIFPSLDQGMRDTDLFERMSPYGAIPERSVLPTILKQEWNFWSGFRGVYVCIDGEFGAVLKTYREVLQGAGPTWLDGRWPQIKLAMKHFMEDYDNGDGVIRGPQFNTYDCIITGANTFIGTLYLAALRAAEEMAILQNDPVASEYRARFRIGSYNLDKICWGGSYYINPEYDPAGVALGHCSFTDQLLGQWWAHILGLGYLLPKDHVKLALQSFFQNNHQVGFNLNEEAPRKFMDERDDGLWVGRWPDGGVPPIPIYYNAECWSGVEYPNAANSFFEGLNDQALRIVDDVRARQDGTRRSPWNEVECGDYYSRQQSSWSLLDAATGYFYNAPKNSITFNPKMFQSQFTCFFITGTGWGTYNQSSTDISLSSGNASLTVAYGSVKLKTLIITSAANRITSAFINNTVVPVSSAQQNGKLVITFQQIVTLGTRSVLKVNFTR